MPMMVGPGKLKTEVKQGKRPDLRVNKSECTFFQRAVDQMNDSEIRKKLFRSGGQQQWKKQGMKS